MTKKKKSYRVRLDQGDETVNETIVYATSEEDAADQVSLQVAVTAEELESPCGFKTEALAMRNKGRIDTLQLSLDSRYHQLKQDILRRKTVSDEMERTKLGVGWIFVFLMFLGALGVRSIRQGMQIAALEHTTQQEIVDD